MLPDVTSPKNEELIQFFDRTIGREGLKPFRNKCDMTVFELLKKINDSNGLSFDLIENSYNIVKDNLFSRKSVSQVLFLLANQDRESHPSSIVSTLPKEIALYILQLSPVEIPPSFNEFTQSIQRKNMLSFRYRCWSVFVNQVSYDMIKDDEFLLNAIVLDENTHIKAIDKFKKTQFNDNRILDSCMKGIKLAEKIRKI